MVEINEGTLGPQQLAEIVASDNLATALEQKPQHLKRLILQFDADAISAEFAGLKICFEDAESNDTAPHPINAWNVILTLDFAAPAPDYRAACDEGDWRKPESAIAL